jgi:AcrR family transcriptional regulator
VLRLSGAPRGSVYFHFPGGKTELAIEAAAAHAHEQVETIDRAAEQADSATRLVEIYVDLGRKGMVASDYTRGCGIAPLVNEGAAQDSHEVAQASRQSFAEMADRLTHHFVAFDLPRPTARTLADAVIAGVEGAMVTARAQRSTAPYDAVQTVLTHYAASVSPRSTVRRRGQTAAGT